LGLNLKDYIRIITSSNEEIGYQQLLEEEKKWLLMCIQVEKSVCKREGNKGKLTVKSYFQKKTHKREQLRKI